MSRTHRPLPIPQHEFPFTRDTFNLIQDTAPDSDRLARDQADQATREQARRDTARSHPRLFNESDCGGAFDGFTVTSDADPGL